MNRTVALLIALVLCSSANGQNTTPSFNGTGLVSGKSAIVSANLAVTGPTIPSSFVGISGEVGDLIAGYYQGTTGNAASYIGLAKLLGANGYLRVGGNSADAGTPPALTSGIAGNLASFVAGIGSGWKVIYTLDAVANNSATAATQAGLLATALGTANVIFQYGNEPITSGHFNNGTYATMWNAYQTAVVATVPGDLTGAPDDALSGTGGTNNQTTLSGLSVANSAQAFITIHAYEYCSPTTLIAAQYPLGNWNTVNTRNFGSVGSWAAVTKMRVTEQNSICNHGQAGMTDTLMNAAYYVMKAATLAQLGWAGMDTHNTYTVAGPPANYNPFVQQVDGGFSPGPAFYGMYVMSQVEGQTIVNSSVAGNANIVSIATQRVAGKANLIVANVDALDTVTTTPQQSSAWSTASILTVRAGSGKGCADTSITLGGQPIGEGGSWSGASFSINNGQSFALGPCEIAEVQFQ